MARPTDRRTAGAKEMDEQKQAAARRTLECRSAGGRDIREGVGTGSTEKPLSTPDQRQERNRPTPLTRSRRTTEEGSERLGANACGGETATENEIRRAL